MESVQFKVINGTPAASGAKDPSVQDMDIRTGVTVSQKPFCRVRLNGTAIEGVDALVQVKEFKPHAFAAPVNNLAGTNPDLALAAPQGRELKKQVDALNSALTNGKIYNAGDYDANILTYAETLRDNSFTIIRYRGYSSTGESINAAPTNASGAAIIIRTSINYMAIIAIPFDNTGVYSRVKDNGTWKAWTH